MDHDVLVPIDHIEIGLAGDGATAVGEGLAIVAQQLTTLDAKEKVLIVLTTGRTIKVLIRSWSQRPALSLTYGFIRSGLSGSQSGFNDDIELGDLKTTQN